MAEEDSELDVVKEAERDSVSFAESDSDEVGLEREAVKEDVEEDVMVFDDVSVAVLEEEDV